MVVNKAVLGVADYVVFSFMLLVSAGIGVYFKFAGSNQTTEEFLLAGKDMGVLPVAFSVMVSFISASAVIGAAAEIYQYGICYILVTVGFGIGTAISAYAFVPVFFDMQASTVYEYLDRRFGRLTRMVTSVIFVVQTVFFMAVTLYAPGLALSAVTNLSTWVSVVSVGIVCTFYCTLGGMKAVLWTDVFQAILMFLGVFAVMVKGIGDVGSAKEVVRRAVEGQRLSNMSWSVNFTERYTVWNTLLQGIMLSMSLFGSNQVQVQRLMTVKNITRSRLAMFINIPLGVAFNILIGFIGVILYANYAKCDPVTSPNGPIDSFDQLLPYYMVNSLGQYTGLAGLCICGVFSAALSTVSSAVNSLSAVSVDIIARQFSSSGEISEGRAAFLVKITSLLYGAACILLTFVVARFGTLIQASLTVNGMLGGPVFSVFFLGMFTKRANNKGVIIGLATAVAFSAWLSFGPPPEARASVRLPVSTENCPATNTSSELFNISTYLTNPNETLGNYSKALLSTSDSSVPLGLSNENAYIFPLYKISYLWIMPIGFIVGLVIGYISSIIVEKIEGHHQHVPAEYLSPAVRWLFRDNRKDVEDIKKPFTRVMKMLKRKSEKTYL